MSEIYLKSNISNPLMGLNNKVCENPRYWCRNHQVWLSENDVDKKRCRHKLTFDMIGEYVCPSLEVKEPCW